MLNNWETSSLNRRLLLVSEALNSTTSNPSSLETNVAVVVLPMKKKALHKYYFNDVFSYLLPEAR